MLVFISVLKQTLLFAYGTSQDIADRHHPQSRSVAYTIGGLLIFVTLPFLYGGTVYLLYEEFSFLTTPVVRWTTVLLVAAMITGVVLWIERALLVLSDAIWPHFSAHLAMFLIRIGMVFLFSAVIAQKWVLNSYAGPIQKELVAMANEAQTLENKNANAIFNVQSLKERLTTAQDRSRELERQLATLPQHIVIATTQLDACKVEMMRLNAERNQVRRIQDRTDAQNVHLRALEVSAATKAENCRLQQKSINDAVSVYREPINTELTAAKAVAVETLSKFDAAEKSANTQATDRASQTAKALTLNGADQEAFARVRIKNPDIDLEVRKKTLLLAALELLPLLLKLLTYNSPIAMEARACLQQESEGFRDRLRESIAREKNTKSRATRATTPNTAGWGYATASPYVPPPMPAWDASVAGHAGTSQQ